MAEESKNSITERASGLPMQITLDTGMIKKPQVTFAMKIKDGVWTLYMRIGNTALKPPTFGSLYKLTDDTILDAIVQLFAKDRETIKLLNKTTRCKLLCRLGAIYVKPNFDTMEINNNTLQVIIKRLIEKRDECVMILMDAMLEEAKQKGGTKNSNILYLYDALCAEEDSYTALCEAIDLIYEHCIDLWKEDRSEKKWEAAYQCYMMKITKNVEMNKLQRFYAKTDSNICFGVFIYDICLGIRTVFIFDVQKILFDFYLCPKERSKMNQRYSKEELLYIAWTMGGSSYNSVNTQFWSRNYKNKYTLLLISSKMVLDYNGNSDQYETYIKHVPQRLRNENNGFLRILKPVFIDYTLSIIEKINELLPMTLIQNKGDLKPLFEAVLCQEFEKKFTEIITKLIDDDNQDEEGDIVVYNNNDIHKIWYDFTRGVVTRTGYSMLRNKMKSTEALSLRKKLKFLHVCSKKQNLVLKH